MTTFVKKQTSETKTNARKKMLFIVNVKKTIQKTRGA